VTDTLGRDLAAALLATHRMAARFLKSTHRPVLEDFEQLAASCVDTMHPARIRAINRDLAPIVAIDKLVTRLEELAAKMRRRAHA
jgi:hypothetical protein